MKPIKTRRIRWRINDSIVEQDCALISPEQWEEAKRLDPSLASWGAFRFGSRLAVVSFPLGLGVPRKSNAGQL